VFDSELKLCQKPVLPCEPDALQGVFEQLPARWQVLLALT